MSDDFPTHFEIGEQNVRARNGGGLKRPLTEDEIDQLIDDEIQKNIENEKEKFAETTAETRSRL